MGYELYLVRKLTIFIMKQKRMMKIQNCSLMIKLARIVQIRIYWFRASRALSTTTNQAGFSIKIPGTPSLQGFWIFVFSTKVPFM